MDLGTTKARTRRLAIATAVGAAAIFLAGCGSSSGPVNPPIQNGFGGGQPSASAQHIHDALINGAFIAPVGFDSPKLEEGDLTDQQRKGGVVSRVHVGFASPQSSGVSFYVFGSADQAKAWANDYAKNIPSDSKRIASKDAPGAVCADSTWLGGFCGLLIGQTFITSNATTVDMGAGPLMAAARSSYSTANP